jgi:large subunit ribosomal protein L31
MKDAIHPQYFEATVHCGGCGSSFKTGAVIPEIRIGVCSQCHPFYTGQSKVVDTQGRVDRFKKRYSKSGAPQQAPVS